MRLSGRKARPSRAPAPAPASSAAQRLSDFRAAAPARLAALEDALATGERGKAIALADWFGEHADIGPRLDWVDDAADAKYAHFVQAPDAARACDNYVPYLIEMSVAFKYGPWPRSIEEHVRGRRVLDLGCGIGAYGTGFLLAGARSYTGVDPRLDLDGRLARDKRRRRNAELAMTPREIMEACPAIRLMPARSEDLSIDERFDVIVMNNVTEHLHAIGQIIPGLPRLLEPDGRLVFHHHNFYCWNGHHLFPHNTEEIDPDSERQRELVDWNHILVAPTLPDDHYVKQGLNRIRLDELRELTEQSFEILAWNEYDSPRAQLDRLDDDIVDRIGRFDPTLTRRELTVNRVLCVAQTRDR